MIYCKLHPLTRKEEDHVQKFLKEEKRKGHIHPKMTSIGEKQIVMGCRKANTYIIRSNKAMTCYNMMMPTGKKPLLKTNGDWQYRDTPIVNGKSDKTTTESRTSIMQLRFANALSCLQDTL